MHVVPGVEVIRRIEAELATCSMQAIIATDADGTLWSGDVGEDVFGALLEVRGIREETREALVREAKLAGLPTSGTVHELAERIQRATSCGGHSEERCYSMVAWAFAGWTLLEANEFARDLAKHRRLEKRIHPEMHEVVRWIQTRGIELWVVSASPVFMVRAVVELLGIEPSRVIGASPGIREGRFVSWLEEPMPFGAGKVLGLAKAAGDCEIVAAFGDELFDLEMLARARVPVAVRPKARLRECAWKVPLLVELERLCW